MKKILKKILPEIIISFLASFMLFIYEPIITYSTNINDFWFDSKLMMPVIFFYSIMLFLLFMYINIYMHFALYSLKKEKIHKFLLIIAFVILIFSYIEGVYLSTNLPKLDGESIDWGLYKKEKIIEMVTLLGISAAEIIGIIRFKVEKVIKANCFILCAVFIMLCTSLVSVLIKPEFYEEKVMAVATTKNINNISSNKNFLIFLTDAVDSMEFSTVTNDEKIFKDFTYYPDTVSTYIYTRDSIPFIFSGIWNRNEMKFSEYSTKAYNESKLLNRLKKEGYNINIFEYDIVWNDIKAEEASNLNIYKDKLDKITFLREFAKFLLYKYLPYTLKKYSKIETLNFKYSRIDEIKTTFEWFNGTIYKLINDNNKLNKIDQNYFQFIHVEGGHTPFNYDENVNLISEDKGTYDMKLKTTAKVIEAYLNRLKENDAYDNSVIIVMADHGYYAHGNGRQNPILYIKGIDEHHEMNTSEIPVSYEDLTDTFTALLNGEKSENLFKDIDKSRIRKFLNNKCAKEASMKEYEQRGKAWDGDATVETGVVYNR